MKTIHKFKLKKRESQNLSLPQGAQILSVGQQDGELVLWSRVNTTEKEMEQHEIMVYGTGNPVNEHDINFIGTVQMPDGMVLHVFENL